MIGSLPRRSTTIEPASAKAGGIFSVPLSFGSPRPGVTRRTALRSSDFPPAFASFDATTRRPIRTCHANQHAFRRVGRIPQSGRRPAIVQPTANTRLYYSHRLSWQPCREEAMHWAREGRSSRRIPERSGTAPASCTGCCEGCRSLRPSSRYSSRSRAAWRPETRAPRCL